MECCITTCENNLTADYWNNQYKQQTTGWDLGMPSPPIVNFFETYTNKQAAILIPGCGNAYEAEYLLEKGFTNITLVDIAEDLVAELNNKFANNHYITVLHQDFFELKGAYDVIIEQTFFCALPPFLRTKYVYKTYQLLKPTGILVGLLFDRDFEKSPPYGGSKAEYESLFAGSFTLHQIQNCTTSVTPRLGSELFIHFQKNVEVALGLFQIAGSFCSSCAHNSIDKLKALPEIVNATLNVSYNQLLVVSHQAITIQFLQNILDERMHLHQL